MAVLGLKSDDVALFLISTSESNKLGIEVFRSDGIAEQTIWEVAILWTKRGRCAIRAQGHLVEAGPVAGQSHTREGEKCLGFSDISQFLPEPSFSPIGVEAPDMGAGGYEAKQSSENLSATGPEWNMDTNPRFAHISWTTSVKKPDLSETIFYSRKWSLYI